MKYIHLVIFFLFAQFIFPQSKLPVIKATSKKAAVKDGAFSEKSEWTLSPDIKPDVYTADRTRDPKWITFYTDIDSIRIKIKPGSRFDFIVLLNGKDSCHTQIASAITPESSPKHVAVTHDTIPFVLTSFNAIHVKCVINNTDTLNLHFDVGSFDFRFTRDAILKKTKLLSNQPGVPEGNIRPDYSNLGQVFKLQMGQAVWHNPEIIATGFTAHEMDGRFGWNLFEGKTVEIDYDHHLIIIHSMLTKKPKGYAKSKIEFIHSFVCMKGSFEIARKKYTGNFLLDTGSDQAVILDSNWAVKQNFRKDLKLIRTSVLKDPRGVKYETRVLAVPLIRLNDFVLTDIPAYVLGSKNPVGFEINYLGNDLLKRFNMVLDLKHDRLYLQPNKLTGVKYRES